MGILPLERSQINKGGKRGHVEDLVTQGVSQRTQSCDHVKPAGEEPVEEVGDRGEYHCPKGHGEPVFPGWFRREQGYPQKHHDERDSPYGQGLNEKEFPFGPFAHDTVRADKIMSATS